MQIDDKDYLIINQLTKNARESASNIAEIINMSVPAVTERIKKLQESGVIQGFSISLDNHKIGMDVSAFITIISESSANFEDVVNQANNNPYNGFFVYQAMEEEMHRLKDHPVLMKQNIGRCLEILHCILEQLLHLMFLQLMMILF